MGHATQSRPAMRAQQTELSIMDLKGRNGPCITRRDRVNTVQDVSVGLYLTVERHDGSESARLREKEARSAGRDELVLLYAGGTPLRIPDHRRAHDDKHSYAPRSRFLAGRH